MKHKSSESNENLEISSRTSTILFFLSRFSCSSSKVPPPIPENFEVKNWWDYTRVSTVVMVTIIKLTQ